VVAAGSGTDRRLAATRCSRGAHAFGRADREGAGIETREQILALRGTLVGVPQSALPRQEGELFWSELVGFEVVDRDGRSLGQVEGLTDNGAHPILRVRDASGETPRERLIPWVPIYIDRVDAPSRRIEVDWDPEY